MHDFPAHLVSRNGAKIARIKAIAGLIDVSIPISYSEFVCWRMFYSQCSIPASFSSQTLKWLKAGFCDPPPGALRIVGIYLWTIHLLRVPDDSEVWITDQALKHLRDECVGFPLRFASATQCYFTALKNICVEQWIIKHIKRPRNDKKKQINPHSYSSACKLGHTPPHTSPTPPPPAFTKSLKSPTLANEASRLTN